MRTAAQMAPDPAPKPPAMAVTGIGSVPFNNLERTLDLVFEVSPDLPWTPQLVNLTPQEEMLVQPIHGMPFLFQDNQNNTVYASVRDRENNLTEFYERFLQQDWGHFSIPPEWSPGLNGLLSRLDRPGECHAEWAKAQVCGPITFALSIKTDDGRNLREEPDLWEASIKGIGAKAAWVAQKVSHTGRGPIIFFDEPSLTGLGSGFFNITAGEVVTALNGASETAKTGGNCLTGVHICGNSDWNAILSLDVDIISFDAFSYLEQFLIHDKEIESFLGRGGMIAWGITPILNEEEVAPKTLAEMLISAWERLGEKGIDPSMVRERSLITPACGTGSLDPGSARKVLKRTAWVKEILNR